MRSDLPSYSSSVGHMDVHLRFKVKYCHKIFEDDRVEKRCGEIFLETAEKYGFNISEMGFDLDHGHITMDMGPTHSVASIAKALKGTSGRKLLKEFPYLKQRYFWGSGLWSPSCYFDSVGEINSEEMNRYVRSQGDRRKTESAPNQRTLLDFTPA